MCECVHVQPSQWASWWWGATATWRRAGSTSTDYKRQALSFVTQNCSPLWLPFFSPLFPPRHHYFTTLAAPSLLQLFIDGWAARPGGAALTGRANICGSSPCLWLGLFVNSPTCLCALLGLTPGAIYWPQSALPGIPLLGVTFCL